MATSMAAATIGHVRLLSPLRERDFALLWTGMTVSLLGDGIFIVAEAWQVYDIDNDPGALSLVGLAWTGGMTASCSRAGSSATAWSAGRCSSPPMWCARSLYGAREGFRPRLR